MTCITKRTGILHFTWSQGLIVRLVYMLSTYKHWTLCPCAQMRCLLQHRANGDQCKFYNFHPTRKLCELEYKEHTGWYNLEIMKSYENQTKSYDFDFTNNSNIGDIIQRAERLWTVVLAGRRGCRWRGPSMIHWSTQ